MSQAILALNAGSSSIKFAVYRTDDQCKLTMLYKGTLDNHADDTHFAVADASGKKVALIDDAAADVHAEPVIALLARIEPLLENSPLVAVGHRIVHGGADFSQPIVIDGSVAKKLASLTPLAPLHQPGCLAAVNVLRSNRPHLRQVGCFDTAFHHGLDPVYRNFPIPAQGPDIRRYGFHGLSFEYIASQLDGENRRVVVAHLGSGSSLCAMRAGRSINTTMSLTPLDGLMMATRSGAIDPGLLLYLQKSRRMSADDLEDLLYHKSGLLGVSGVSADMRKLLAADDEHCRLAVEQFCARAAEQVAIMATSLSGIDCVIFTGGIGENSPEIREKICARLAWLGVEIDERANRNAATTISSTDSAIEVRVIRTDEERVIAAQTVSILQGHC